MAERMRTGNSFAFLCSDINELEHSNQIHLPRVSVIMPLKGFGEHNLSNWRSQVKKKEIMWQLVVLVNFGLNFELEQQMYSIKELESARVSWPDQIYPLDNNADYISLWWPTGVSFCC